MELTLFIAMTVYLIIFSQFFANTSVLFIFGAGVLALLAFNAFTRKFTRTKLIFYIAEFFGFTMFWTGHIGFLGIILYSVVSNSIYYKATQKA